MSPVIGVLLLTALVVGLVSIASITVFDVLESQDRTTDDVELQTTSFDEYTEVDLLRATAPVTIEYENGTSVSYSNTTSLRIPENTTANIRTNDVFVQQVNADAEGNKTQSSLAWRTAADWDKGNTTTSTLIHDTSGSLPASTIHPPSQTETNGSTDDSVKLLYEYESYTDSQNIVRDSSNSSQPDTPINSGTGNGSFTTISSDGFGEVGSYNPGPNGLDESRVVVENASKLEDKLVGAHSFVTWVRPGAMQYLTPDDEKYDNATLIGGYDNDRVWQDGCTVTQNSDGGSGNPAKPGGERPASDTTFNKQDSCSVGYTDNGILDASIGPNGRLGGGFYEAETDELSYTRSGSTETVAKDQWSLVAVSWDGTTDGDGDEIQGYINQTQVFSVAANANPADDAGERHDSNEDHPLYLGGEVDPVDPDDSSADTDDGFRGEMDRTRVYNRSLAPSEVTEIYDTTRTDGYASSIKSVTNSSKPSKLSVSFRNEPTADEAVNISIAGSPGRGNEEVVQHPYNYQTDATRPVNKTQFNRTHQLYRVQLAVKSESQPNISPVIKSIGLEFGGKTALTESAPSPSSPSSNCDTLADMSGTGTSSDPYVVTDDQELQSLNCELDASYKLDTNINASETDSWNGGSGFNPIAPDTDTSEDGHQGPKFTGSFDGQGHTINGLYINRKSANKVGLFAFSRAPITSLKISNAKMTGDSDTLGNIAVLVGRNEDLVRGVSVSGTVNGNSIRGTGGLIGVNTGTVEDSSASVAVSASRDASANENLGGLIGFNGDGGTLSNVTATGNVDGTAKNVGGLIGKMQDGSLDNGTATGDVSGGALVGGLIGKNNGPQVRKSSASGDVAGAFNIIGGLIGDNSGSVLNSSASGDVTGRNGVGGLIGQSIDGSVRRSSASGSALGQEYVGGLVGLSSDDTDDSFATGKVDGREFVGGLVGFHNGEAVVGTSFAAGQVTGEEPRSTGGLIGYNNGEIFDSYWDKGTTNEDRPVGSSGTETNVVGYGSTGDTAPAGEMQGSRATSKMDALDFTNTWATVDGDYPRLQE